MTAIAEVLAYDFMRNAVAAGVLASVLCGVIGAFVVVKRLVFISGGISHAAFGGLGLFHFLGLAPFLGAVTSAVSCALVLGFAGGERLRSNDALIGVLWAFGMALGIVFIQLAPGYAPDLMAVLFGDILTVTPGQLEMMLWLGAVVLATIALLYKELLAVCFDESFARIQGVPVSTLMTTLLLLVAISIVMLIHVVGIILVIALLSIPPLVGLQIAGDFRGLLVTSVVTALGMTQAGLALSYAYDLPSGPAIILLGTALLCAVAGVRAIARRHLRPGSHDT